MNAPTVVVLVGPKASGKTEWAMASSLLCVEAGATVEAVAALIAEGHCRTVVVDGYHPIDMASARAKWTDPRWRTAFMLFGTEEPQVAEEEFTDQPVVWDGHGVIRFLKNPIVDDLLAIASKYGMDLNQISCTGYPDWARRQLAQLIGYSVFGYGDLSYVNEEAWARVDAAQVELYATQHEDPRHGGVA